MYAMPSPNHYDPATVTHYRTPRGDAAMQFRNLDDHETAEFRQWARDNYTPGEPISPLWHPIVREECQHINEEDEENATHYHVVAFINGCLNDYDSGPIEDYAQAQDALQDYLGWQYGDMPADDRAVKRVAIDRYQDGLHTITIEECAEECDPEADY